ncbi:MAG: hypothetical protein ABI811_18810 [Acidobacteriota bacterium]
MSLNSSATSSNSANSFAQQLAATIEGFLNQTPQGSHLQINIAASGSQSGSSHQFVVTITDPDKAVAGETPVPVAPTSAAAVGGMMYSGTVDAATQPKVSIAVPPITNETDAYWAQQPKEVQVLRTIDDLKERVEKGKELAQKGYLVDYDIMIWRQDPYMTMRIREGEGYTWTPAMGQPGVTLPAGIAFPGMTGYDAGHPLAGAIRVSTDFAKGLEDTSPWYGPKSPANG